jgi:tetratricopeptide (TPR) repeat protein
VGFRIRKSINIAPGVRLNVSKSGIGYSVGVKGYRVTKQVDGRVRRTASLPGTGLSYVTTSGSSSIPRSANPSPATMHTRKPGFFAPKGEKQLYRAVQAKDVDAMRAIAREHPNYALAAQTIGGLLEFERDDAKGAVELLAPAFATGADPAQDRFISKYLRIALRLQLAPGVTVALGVDRSALGLTLSEAYQDVGDLEAAVDVVEQLEPTTYAAVSLSELYLLLDRNDDVVELTDGVTNTDDATALLCVFRGVALREQGHFDAARAVFREALASKKRNPVIRHRAWLERARTYEAEGKRAQARKDLESIMAEDSTYEGLADELAALDKSES